nr:hypothetical protein [uncultured bacterium]
MNNNKKASPWNSIKVGFLSLLAMVIFAYGFQITKVDLEELRSENRQQSLVRVTRALAQPEIFEYDQVEEVVNYPIYVPCPSDGGQASAEERGASDPYIVSLRLVQILVK